MTKYLKLTNTEKCLELAECLVGSKVKTDCGIDILKYWDGYYQVIFDPRANIKSEDSFINEILLPLDTLKLNPFKCMEHKIPVKRKDGCRDNGRITMYRERSDSHPYDEFMISGGGGFRNDNFTLDLNNLPEGASIVEVEE
jgi:hypothetical protein